MSLPGETAIARSTFQPSLSWTLSIGSKVGISGSVFAQLLNIKLHVTVESAKLICRENVIVTPLVFSCVLVSLS